KGRRCRDCGAAKCQRKARGGKSGQAIIRRVVSLVSEVRPSGRATLAIDTLIENSGDQEATLALPDGRASDTHRKINPDTSILMFARSSSSVKPSSTMATRI